MPAIDGVTLMVSLRVPGFGRRREGHRLRRVAGAGPGDRSRLRYRQLHAEWHNRQRQLHRVALDVGERLAQHLRRVDVQHLHAIVDLHQPPRRDVDVLLRTIQHLQPFELHRHLRGLIGRQIVLHDGRERDLVAAAEEARHHQPHHDVLAHDGVRHRAADLGVCVTPRVVARHEVMASG